jgi:hypothetical protein
MKTKLMIVVLFVLMVWGCMGCENSPTTTDLSDDRSLLTATLWQAQQKGARFPTWLLPGGLHPSRMQ